MSLRRVGCLAAAGLAILLWTSCGQVYRPVVLPVATTPPDPAGFHAVFGITTNIPANQGSALQIDVAGDTNIGEAEMGESPTHAAILPNDSRVFVASAGSMYPGDTDIITAFTPAVDAPIATGLGTPIIFSLPNVIPSQSTTITGISESGSTVTVTLSSPLIKAASGGTIEISNVSVAGFNGAFPITAIVNSTTIQYTDSATGLGSATAGTATIPIPLSCSYLPDYVTTTQATAVFAANYGVENDPDCNLSSTDSVAILSTILSSVSLIQYLPAGSHPVAMVETPDQQNLYVLNQNNTILNLSPTDLSLLANVPLPSGSTSPIWAVARPDAEKVYVLTQGDGSLQTITTASNTITSTQSVGGPGANFILYDNSRNRLYVTNPTAGNVYIFDATADPPSPLSVISMNGTNAPCPGGCSPASVAALPDGSRFYVASYQLDSSCPDPNVGTTAACLIPTLTVFDAASMTVKPASSTLSELSPSLSLLNEPQFSATQYAIPVPTTGSPCVPAATYTPGSTRFRMFTTASADSTHVYVSICDGGAIADIATTTTTLPTGGTNTPDSLITDLVTPFETCEVASCSTPATITSFSIASNVVTFQATNQFVAGQSVVISGLSTGTYLDGLTLTVLATGLSGTQFECNFTGTNIGSTPDSGNAVPLPPLQNPVFLLTGQ
jgi:hypothetical protein